MPITSRDLMKPNKVCFLESNTAWVDYEVVHPAILIPFGSAHTVFFNPLRPPGPDAINLKEYYNDLSGIIYLPTPGRWWFNLPLAGSAAAQVCFRVIDCASPESANILLKLMGSVGAGSVNLAQWGGQPVSVAQVANGAISQAVVGPTVNGRDFYYDPLNARWAMQVGYEETNNSQTAMGGVSELRKSGYISSRRGRRFTAKSPNITGVAAATALTTTAPTYYLEPGATNEHIMRRFTVSMPLKGTSTTFQVLIKTDNTSRFSAGGTTRTPLTWNSGNAVAWSGSRSLEAPTLTAEGGGTRDIDVKTGLVSDGAVIEFLFEDGLVIQASGCFIAYVITATAGATVHYVAEFEDVDVQ